MPRRRGGRGHQRSAARLGTWWTTLHRPAPRWRHSTPPLRTPPARLAPLARVLVVDVPPDRRPCRELAARSLIGNLTLGPIGPGSGDAFFRTHHASAAARPC